MTTGAKIAWGVGIFLVIKSQAGTLGSILGSGTTQSTGSSPAAAASQALATLVKGLQNAISGAGKASASHSGTGGGGNPAGGAGSGRSTGASNLDGADDSFATFDNINQPSTLQPAAQQIAANTNAPTPAPDFSFLSSDSPDLSALAAPGSAAIPLLNPPDSAVDPNAGAVASNPPPIDPSLSGLAGDFEGSGLSASLADVGNIDADVGL